MWVTALHSKYSPKELTRLSIDNLYASQICPKFMNNCSKKYMDHWYWINCFDRAFRKANCAFTLAKWSHVRRFTGRLFQDNFCWTWRIGIGFPWVYTEIYLLILSKKQQYTSSINASLRVEGTTCSYFLTRTKEAICLLRYGISDGGKIRYSEKWVRYSGFETMDFTLQNVWVSERL